MPIKTNTIHTGDAFDVLENLPKSAVHMAMTSPPYWQLRDYGHDEQLGMEETAEGYVNDIADVMDGLKRVLRDDGSLWLNLGDTYKNKDLQQIPARVALELQSRGWILRNRVTWAKPNPMPQSMKDRLNGTTEAIFHLVPNSDYWYDLDAIRAPYSEYTKNTINRNESKVKRSNIHNQSGLKSGRRRDHVHPGGKNPGDVFEVPTKTFSDAHFAVYPPELCKKPIKATCPPDGIVLDPFAGAGTTLYKAKELGRRFVGIELKPEYADIARARVGLMPDDPSNVRDDPAQMGLKSVGE